MSKIQKIMPCLWFDSEAEEAARFYNSLFKSSKILNITKYNEAGYEIHGKKAGTVLTVRFSLDGCELLALNGGPQFKFNPSISLFVNCATQKEVDELWKKLSKGGEVLMELDKYPFSEKFGWVQDKYGLSWQLNLGERKQKIAPFLMYVGEQHGKAEEAINFYVSLFKNSRVINVTRYGAGENGVKGAVKHSIFSLGGQEFMAMDSNAPHQFTFNEAISLCVECKDQDEIDYYWEKLSEGGEKGQCGWLKDRYGVSWQTASELMSEKMLNDPDPKRSVRVMEAILKMNKIDIKKLEEAYNGK